MTAKSRLWLVVALGCSGCVVGRGHGDSDLPKSVKSPATGMPRDAGSDGRAAASAGSGGAPTGANAGTRSASTGGADSGSGGQPSSDAKDGGRARERDASMATTTMTTTTTTTGSDAGMAMEGDAECAPAVDVCNPVTNEGCLDSLSMQCAVDYTSTLTGYCIFYSGDTPTPGVDCLNTGITESCPPTKTCVDGECRQLCFCNADCDAGQCCVQRLEDTGFKVCGDC